MTKETIRQTCDLCATLGGWDLRTDDPRFADGKRTCGQGEKVNAVLTLQGIARRLHRLDEQACNGVTRYDPDLGRVVMRWTGRDEDTNTAAVRRAMAQAAKIAASIGCTVYHQDDPRGCSLWLGLPGQYLAFDTYTQGLAIPY